MAITPVKIRAKIEIGSLSIVTPYILSFNVTRSRGQVSTFSASLKVSHRDTVGDITGDTVEISAGEGTPKKIFTGMVKKATMTPCFDDPDYVVLNLSGADVLCLLEGKKYTRRCAGQKTAWVLINGVTRTGLKSGKFKYKQEEALFVTSAEVNEDPNLHTATGISAVETSVAPNSTTEGKPYIEATFVSD